MEEIEEEEKNQLSYICKTNLAALLLLAKEIERRRRRREGKGKYRS